MGSLLVVVLDVLGEDSLEVATREHQEMVKAVLTHGANPAFGEGIGFRSPDRREDRFNADRRKDLVKTPRELRIAIADQESHAPASVAQIGTEVPCHLSDPGSVGVCRDTEKMYDAPLEFDDEEDVVPAEQNSVNTQKVGSDDGIGLRTEEVGPRGSRSTWRGTESVATQDVRHARSRDIDTELLQLADDAHVAPKGDSPVRAG